MKAGVTPDATICVEFGVIVPLPPLKLEVTVYVRPAAQLADVPVPTPAHDQVNWLTVGDFGGRGRGYVLTESGAVR